MDPVKSRRTGHELSAQSVSPQSVSTNGQERVPATSVSRRTGAPTAAFTVAGHRILVVDDEKSITDLVAMALTCTGPRWRWPTPGPRRCGPSQTFRPHLVVLDVMLPDLDGFEVLKRMGGSVARPTSRCCSSPHAATSTTGSAGLAARR